EGSPKLLRLGILMTIPSRTIQKILQPFQRQEAGLVTELFEGSEQEIQNRMDEGRIDLALTILRPGTKNKTVSLYQEPYSLAIASHHPLAARKIISPTELANEPTIVRSRCEALSETSRFFTDHNVRPRLVYRTAQDERALAMVAAGVGFTTMPDHYRMTGVTRRPMKGYDLSREVGFIQSIHPAGEEKSALLDRFITLTRASPPDMTIGG
ncbi:Hydrogen peroxide-inducible genes activator, partial [hydrothermal vent metagenome]